MLCEYLFGLTKNLILIFAPGLVYGLKTGGLVKLAKFSRPGSAILPSQQVPAVRILVSSIVDASSSVCHFAGTNLKIGAYWVYPSVSPGNPKSFNKTR